MADLSSPPTAVTVSCSGFPLNTTTITTRTAVTTSISTRAVVSRAGVGGFPRFLIEDDAPADHHYYNKHVSVSGEVPETISLQWHSLDDSLPDSISVRVYRSRLSLLRAAIVGGVGTPYHNHLFFFDMFLPPEFPASPPRVYFRFSTFRVNPNLLARGRVRLKILNTWFGASWKSDTTLLEVLDKIRALFNDNQPYFLEPGFAGRRQDSSWQGVSNRYTEKVYVLCCNLTLRLLQDPPTDFRAVVIAHFRECAVGILNDLNRYRLANIGTTIVVCGGLQLRITKRYKDAIQHLSTVVCGDFELRITKRHRGTIQHLYGQLRDLMYNEYGALLAHIMDERM